MMMGASYMECLHCQGLVKGSGDLDFLVSGLTHARGSAVMMDACHARYGSCDIYIILQGKWGV